ncbi:hypothetical protein AGMMS49921_02810 [Endomicrobiia bacterium]|nr:hypothetical protein AGMMS49921_02810 [Endomicrobiia bacterium]
MTVFGMSLRELMAFNEIIKIIAVGGGGEEGEGVEKISEIIKAGVVLWDF